MAHQLLFTSALYGLRAGTSGYCTVMHSPGIRPALITALEGLSLFEHTPENRGQALYSFQPCVVRGSTFQVLSRICDAGPDYSGRTNFVAHHLAFEPGEVDVTFTPADILREWGGWYTSWSGDPRMEQVKMGEIGRIGVPVEHWKSYGGPAAAARLATLANDRVLVQGGGVDNRELLYLLGESMAVCAKAEKDTRSTWNHSFSIGLGDKGRHQDFQWLAGGWEPLARLGEKRTIIDINEVPQVLSEISKRYLDIAQVGHVRPVMPKPPKPVSNVGARQTATPPRGHQSPETRKPGIAKRKPAMVSVVFMFFVLLGIWLWRGNFDSPDSVNSDENQVKGPVASDDAESMEASPISEAERSSPASEPEPFFLEEFAAVLLAVYEEAIDVPDRLMEIMETGTTEVRYRTLKGPELDSISEFGDTMTQREKDPFYYSDRNRRLFEITGRHDRINIEGSKSDEAVAVIINGKSESAEERIMLLIFPTERRESTNIDVEFSMPVGRDSHDRLYKIAKNIEKYFPKEGQSKANGSQSEWRTFGRGRTNRKMTFKANVVSVDDEDIRHEFLKDELFLEYKEEFDEYSRNEIFLFKGRRGELMIYPENDNPPRGGSYQELSRNLVNLIEYVERRDSHRKYESIRREFRGISTVRITNGENVNIRISLNRYE